MAFAFITAKHLIKDDSGRYTAKEAVETRSTMVYNVDEHQLLQASKFFFDNSRISRGEIDTCIAQYTFKALDAGLPKPPALEAAIPTSSLLGVDGTWHFICDNARRLSIFMIALAHVVNLEDCKELKFTGYAFSNMYEHKLAVQLEHWNGKDHLSITDDAWLQAIAIPLLGHRRNIWQLPWDKVCLISDKGWSAWISTFGEMDPAYVSAGSVRLGCGSPCRNGVWKMGVWDSAPVAVPIVGNSQRAESCGQETHLRCAEKVTLATPYCGESEEVFLVSARFRLHRQDKAQRVVERVGYKSAPEIPMVGPNLKTLSARKPDVRGHQACCRLCNDRGLRKLPPRHGRADHHFFECS
ncbi:MAG: hypothetical protein Q9213_001112 [Squamulea squamosa]